MFGASRFREYALGFRVEGLGLEGKGSQVCLEIDRVRDVLLKIDRVVDITSQVSHRCE